MPALRLIPKTDDDPFPYDDALQLLRDLPEAELVAKDFGPLIEAGKRMGWTAKMIRSHEKLAAGGRCYDFAWTGPPAMRGTLFENNLFISVVDDEEATWALAQAWARQLDVDVLAH